uniref:Uncharacterized protein n=1 Tax=mine drainage metagenome TaxID=410659 RepID=E6QQ19_9ZZZZ
MGSEKEEVAIPNGYQPILELYQEMTKAQDANALIAALAMLFVGIGTMAWLSLPLGQTSVKRNDFCSWVDTYLKTDASQPYQYVGIDVYAARCALLHSYGSASDLHKRRNPPKEFSYLDNGPHRADGSQLVLISIAVLIRDFGNALNAFFRSALSNADLKARIDSRIRTLMVTMAVDENRVKTP